MIIENNIDICERICRSKCCKSTPPGLTSEDIKKIDLYHANWKEEIKESGEYVVKKRNKTNECYFLSEKGICIIYDIRPLDCKLFPILFKIKKIGKSKYKIQWFVWYCDLTNAYGVERVKEGAKSIVMGYLETQPELLFEYQKALQESNGYRRKHLLSTEIISI